MGGGSAATLEILNKIEKLEQKLNDINSETSVPAEMLSTSILDYALALPAKKAAFVTLSGSGYSGGDLPSTNYQYGTAIIVKRNNVSINVILFPEGVGGKIIRNAYVGGSWSGWENLSG